MRQSRYCRGHGLDQVLAVESVAPNYRQSAGVAVANQPSAKGDRHAAPNETPRRNVPITTRKSCANRFDPSARGGSATPVSIGQCPGTQAWFVSRLFTYHGG
jgi:hypothetical protein